MLKTLMGLSAASAVLAASVAVQALTVTNNDATSHALTVDEGDDQETAMIEPNATKSDFCASGCTISMKGGQIMKVTGADKLVIENGQIKKM
ncbi:MAG: hypothetical protein RIM84_13985 [Alphaproteobacteria bacterium]